MLNDMSSTVRRLSSLNISYDGTAASLSLLVPVFKFAMLRAVVFTAQSDVLCAAFTQLVVQSEQDGCILETLPATPSSGMSKTTKDLNQLITERRFEEAVAALQGLSTLLQHQIHFHRRGVSHITKHEGVLHPPPFSSLSLFLLSAFSAPFL